MLASPILGQSYVARSVNAANNRLVNLFPEVLDSGKTASYFQRTPGLRLLQTIGTGPIRGVWTNSRDRTKCYVVSGSQAYVITSPTATPTLLGAVTGSGSVSIADNGNQIFFACDPDGFIYDQTTGVFAQITDPDFPGANSVGFIDGFFVFTVPDSQLFYVTALNDGTDVDALDFASAEGSPDGLRGVVVSNLEVWLMGLNSVEVWYNAGLPDFPLARIQGAFNEIGCAATYTLAKTTGGIFWLGSDARGAGIVYRSNGYQARRVSTHAIEWQIQSYGDISDATGYTYQQDGHSFYVLTFPSAHNGRGATWCYDEIVDAWHERESWDEALGLPTRHRSSCQTYFNNLTIVGDYQNGKIYHLDLNTYADDGVTSRWLRSWRALPTGTNNLMRTAHHSLKLDFQTGVGLNGYDYFDPLTDLLAVELTDQILDRFNNVILDRFGNPIVIVIPGVNGLLLAENGDGLLISRQTIQGANPTIMLRWSDDGGHTWSNEHSVTLGRIGQTGTEVTFRRLGMTMRLRDRVYEVSGSDPVKIALMGAMLDVTPTDA